MARPAVLAVKIVTDASDAQKDFGKTTEAMKQTERAARDVSGGIDTAGGASQKAAGGLRDMMGALEGTKFEAFGQTVAKSSTYFEAAAGASDLYAAAAASAGGVTKVWTIIQGAFNTVMALNPVALIVIAVIALVAAIILAYKNSETFRRIADAAFRAVLTAAKAVWSFLSGAFKAIWPVLWTAVRIYFLPITLAWKALKAIIDLIVPLVRDTLPGALETLGSVAKRVLDAIMIPIRAVRDGFQWIIDKVKSLIDWIGKIKIPKVVSGIINAVVPGSAPAPAMTLAGTRTMMPAARGGAAGRARSSSGGVVINLSVPATANPVETGRQIVSMIRRFERVAGPAWRT